MLSIAVIEPFIILIGKCTVLFKMYIANRESVVFYYDNEDN